jgi:hypothetical protein
MPVRMKYSQLTHFVQPELGTAYTYQQWKAAQTWEAIERRISRDHEPDVEGKQRRLLMRYIGSLSKSFSGRRGCKS